MSWKNNGDVKIKIYFDIEREDSRSQEIKLYDIYFVF